MWRLCYQLALGDPGKCGDVWGTPPHSHIDHAAQPKALRDLQPEISREPPPVYYWQVFSPRDKKGWDSRSTPALVPHVPCRRLQSGTSTFPCRHVHRHRGIFCIGCRTRAINRNRGNHLIQMTTDYWRLNRAICGGEQRRATDPTFQMWPSKAAEPSWSPNQDGSEAALDICVSSPKA